MRHRPGGLAGRDDLAPRMSTPAAHRVRVFYQDYDNAVSIASKPARSLMVSRIMPLAERLLVKGRQPGSRRGGGSQRRDPAVLCCQAPDGRSRWSWFIPGEQLPAP